MEFEKFGSLTRFSQGWTITEKLDGSNAQIALEVITEENKNQNDLAVGLVNNPVDGRDYRVFAGSRNKWLLPGKTTDNFGFARWVQENLAELVKLGEGRHFGEWYGSGIQRGYGLTGGDKRFALFNAGRWSDADIRPECCEVVHTFLLDEYVDNPYAAAQGVMSMMETQGSYHIPGFMKPEGIVMFHRKSGTSFKKTFDYDEKGKWAELKG